MNKPTKKEIREGITPILQSRNPYLACDAARIICALEGLWVSESIPDAAGVTPELVLARQQLVGKFAKKRAQRKAANRRNYLRRKLRALQAVRAVQITTTEEHDKEAID